MKRNGEFTINIALIHKKTPVLGVVYSPVLNVCYWAKSNEGAFKDGKKLPLKTKRQRDVYKIVASRSHMSSETKDFIDRYRQRKSKLLSIGRFAWLLRVKQIFIQDWVQPWNGIQLQHMQLLMSLMVYLINI